MFLPPLMDAIVYCGSKASSSRLAWFKSVGLSEAQISRWGEMLSADLQQQGSMWALGAQHPACSAITHLGWKIMAAVVCHAPMTPACRAYKQAVRSLQEGMQSVSQGMHSKTSGAAQGTGRQ